MGITVRIKLGLVCVGGGRTLGGAVRGPVGINLKV